MRHMLIDFFPSPKPINNLKEADFNLKHFGKDNVALKVEGEV
jgi:hypothetical protein